MLIQQDGIENAVRRYSNPHTIQILNHESGRWEPHCWDAPLTLQQAENRVKELNEDSPAATFRIVPWLNNAQIKFMNNLLAELRDKLLAEYAACHAAVWGINDK